MGWQEDEVAKLRAKKEATDNKENIRKKIMFDLWDKFQKINNDLLPELRMTFEKREDGGVTRYFLSGANSWLTFTVVESGSMTCNNYSILAKNNKGELFIGINEHNTLISQQVELEDDKANYFIFDSNAHNLVMKNLIQGVNHPLTGLVKYDYNHKTGYEKSIFEKLTSYFSG